MILEFTSQSDYSIKDIYRRTMLPVNVGDSQPLLKNKNILFHSKIHFFLLSKSVFRHKEFTVAKIKKKFFIYLLHS